MNYIPQPIADILELARWAPSGDNTQPWRFEVVDKYSLIIHAFDTREYCVYDLDGHSSQIAHGALLETIAIAASAYGMQTEYKRRPGSPETHPDYFVKLIPNNQLLPDPLFSFIKCRSVQRRPMHITPLTELQKQTLQDAVSEFCTICWFEGGAQRWRLAKLMFDNAKLRLTLPEAYLVHRNVIEWQARFSEDRVPDQALGLDALTLKLMHWVMNSWQRVDFFNTYLAGHLIPRIEMDLLPSLFCAAHIVMLAHKAPETIDDYVTAGRAVQRFWLTATSLKLNLQPELTPLIFSRYVRKKECFSQSTTARIQAQILAKRLEELLMNDEPKAIFMARIGYGPLPVARSLRQPLRRLADSI